jgi:hypothetical protein
MKKLIYGTLFLALVGIGIIGCKKEISSKQETNNSQSVKEKSILYRVENGMLVLNTVDDFDQLIELSTDDFNQTLKDLDYISYVETLNANDVNTIEDGFLSVALNRNQTIQIQNYIYRINKASSKVFAIHKDHFSSYADLIAENTSNKYVLEFSTEDNVFELLGEVEDTEKALSKKCQSSKENNDGGWNEYADFTDSDNIYGKGTDKRYKFKYRCMVRYDNWGVYRKLFTEFKHKESFGGTWDYTHVSIIYKVKYEIKNGGSGNVTYDDNYSFATNTSIQVPTSQYDYVTDNKEIVHYKGTKCLRAYDLNSWFWMRSRKTLMPILAPSSGCIRINDGGMCAYPCSYDPPC